MEVETEERVLFEFKRYGEERGRWREVILMKDGMHEYDVIKGYKLESDEIEKETRRFFRVMWTTRQKHGRVRECGLA